MKLVPIDFEYHSSEEPNLHLVCCSLYYNNEMKEFWLNNKRDTQKLKEFLLSIRDEIALVSFNVSAEARSLLSLGLDVRKFKWVDIQAEYKMLINHNHKIQYGKHYFSKSKTHKTTKPPVGIYNMTEEEKKAKDFSKPETNLLACTYKLLGKDVTDDKDQKDEMRDLILTRDSVKIEARKDDIQKYCSSDVLDLLKLWERIKEEYRAFFKSLMTRSSSMVSMKEVFFRGETVARQAIIEHIGYPVKVDELKNLAANIPHAYRDLIEDINSQFDWPLFKVNKTNAIGYSRNQKGWQEFIAKTEYADKWAKTEKGAISLAKDSFEEKFNFNHNYPKGNFFAQVIRYLKTDQALKSMNIKGKKETIFHSLGSDGRVRPYLNSYGSQSSRYQPKATSYMFLKTAWTRVLVHPHKDYCICGIDYKSEEALIGALNSNDKAMIEAYRSGDVYLDFAKRAGAVPEDATKSTHKKERDLFKSTYLGISYLMGPKSLAQKLTNDTGVKRTEEEAKDLIDKFYSAYPRYKQYLDRVYSEYLNNGFHKLFDGWVMFGDNDNYRSVSNMPIQGMGAVILRRAIQLAQDAGVKIIAPLHDALYIEYKDPSHIDKLAEAMTQAFVDSYPNNPNASLIKLDIEAWGDSLREGTFKTPGGLVVSSEPRHVDPRGRAEYEKFKKYLMPKN